LTINRPKALNALNIETLKEIQSGIQEVKDHPELKVLIITGAGEKAFVAGADILEMKGMNSIEALNFAKLGHFTLEMKKSGRVTKEVKELQAESVSYVVLKYYQLPAEHQATYLALWSANKDSVVHNLTVIKKAADFIINEMDKIQKDKTKAATPPETPPVPPA
jgi:hypothetical protein